MFNHQSNADMLIMASLIRRDIVGVGKRELKNLPVIGPLMGAAGVVFIDRSDRQAAIETMKPLVQAMQKKRRASSSRRRAPCPNSEAGRLQKRRLPRGDSVGCTHCTGRHS